MAKSANSSISPTLEGSPTRPAQGEDNAAQGHKRKAAKQIKKSTSTKRMKIRIKQTTPFAFIDLPGELRNLIYEQTALTQTVILENGVLTDHSGLLDVSEQFRNEYYPILLLCAGTTVVNVNNFDFRPIVTFLNKLPEDELNILPSINKPAVRAFEVHLNITRGCDLRTDQELLRRWLDRTGHDTKKGTKLDVSYKLGNVDRFSKRRYWWGAPPESIVHDWSKALERYEQMESYSERTNEEAKKIKAALKE